MALRNLIANLRARRSSSVAPAAIDLLVMWGLTLTGLGLMFGALVRWNAFWGAVMMLFFWAASLQGGIETFFRLEHGWLVDDHILYAILLFGLGVVGAGRIIGFDAWFEKLRLIRKAPALKFVLG